MSGAAAAELRALTERWVEAVAARDMPTLDRLLGAEFTFTTGHRGTLGRGEWLETTQRRYVVEEHELEEVVVDVFGDAAVVRSRLRQRGAMGGERRDLTYLLTDTWIRRDGSWQVVSRHSSPLAPLAS
jgi:ketosteroid isomerase-like protein